jgi:His-Xaa-Ser system protein HxsD
MDALVRGDGEIVLGVDEKIYSRAALLRTCYWFTDRCYIFISRDGEERFAVHLRLKQPHTSVLDDIAGEFTNALLDFELRAQLERETATIRELIVAKAFAEGNLLDDAPVGDDRDPVELDISSSGDESQRR